MSKKILSIMLLSVLFLASCESEEPDVPFPGSTEEGKMSVEDKKVS